ncbi:MAG: hypothetical protein AAGD92_07910 [Pseudomonadota bacterium]
MAGQKRNRLTFGGLGAAGTLLSAAPAHASINIGVSAIPAIAGVFAVIAIMTVLVWSILSAKQLKGSSLFNRLFIVVAISSGFFSAVSSAIGFSLITSQENSDLLRNSILPPAFGFFVFFLAVAIWVGGAELVRQKDWFRNMAQGPMGDAIFFLERALKLFVVIPILAIILFFVSTWTTVVGIGGVDAVRHTYLYELDRLQAECAGITSYRQKDFLFLQDLQLSVNDLSRVARNERQSGAQSGSAGDGAVSDYFDGLAEWYETLGENVAAIIRGDDPSGVDPYAPNICAERIEAMKLMLSRNAHDNYDLWAREFETAFNDFTAVLNRWRQDRRIENLLDAQLDNFYRANPKPVGQRMSRAQRNAIDRYADEVESALKSLVRSQKLAKPPVPKKSYAEIYPARGLDIFNEIFAPPAPPAEEERVSRTLAVVKEEFLPSLSIITPRDAVLKNANIFSDIWALAISWDYAAYVLMLAYLFFPSAERAAGYKDLPAPKGASMLHAFGLRRRDDKHDD